MPHPAVQPSAASAQSPAPAESPTALDPARAAWPSDRLPSSPTPSHHEEETHETPPASTRSMPAHPVATRSTSAAVQLLQARPVETQPRALRFEPVRASPVSAALTTAAPSFATQPAEALLHSPPAPPESPAAAS